MGVLNLAMKQQYANLYLRMKKILIPLALIFIFVLVSAENSILNAEVIREDNNEIVIRASSDFVYGYNDTIISAKEKAIEFAKRKAAEEAGVYIESESYMKNYSLSKDEIRSYSATMMKVKIIDEQHDKINSKWIITIEAVVDKVKLNELINKQIQKRDTENKLEQEKLKIEIEKENIAQEKEKIKYEKEKILNGKDSFQTHTLKKEGLIKNKVSYKKLKTPLLVSTIVLGGLGLYYNSVANQSYENYKKATINTQIDRYRIELENNISLRNNLYMFSGLSAGIYIILLTVEY